MFSFLFCTLIAVVFLKEGNFSFMLLTTVSNYFKKFGKMNRNAFDNYLHKIESYLRMKELTTSFKLNGSENIYNLFLQ